MNIAVDVGNTTIKYGKFNAQNELFEQGYVENLDQLVKTNKDSNAYDLIISSVGKHKLDNQSEDFSVFRNVFELNYQSRLPFKLDYNTPETLGADRIAAAAGVLNLNPGGNSLIIDLGTCITYDILEKGETFRGGVISPGKRIRFKSMNDYTHSLPDLSGDHDLDFGIPAKTTSTSMKAGVLSGILFEMEGFIAYYSKKYDKLKTYLCGGEAEYFERRLKHRIFADSNLVLKGLNTILVYIKER